MGYQGRKTRRQQKRNRAVNGLVRITRNQSTGRTEKNRKEEVSKESGLTPQDGQKNAGQETGKENTSGSSKEEDRKKSAGAS